MRNKNLSLNSQSIFILYEIKKKVIIVVELHQNLSELAFIFNFNYSPIYEKLSIIHIFLFNFFKINKKWAVS